MHTAGTPTAPTTSELTTDSAEDASSTQQGIFEVRTLCRFELLGIDD